MELNLQPYNSLENQNYPNELTIFIRQEEFAGVPFQDGQYTFPISKCNFRKLIIKNSEEINFPDITIAFTDCFIEDVQIDTLLCKNITLIFQNSMLSGRIKAVPLKQVSIGNCILRGGLFLLDLSSVYISYTEENISVRRWKALFQRINVADYKEILKIKQSYYIYDCGNITFISNWKDDHVGGQYLRDNADKINRLGYRLTLTEKELLDLNVSLKYDLEKEYKETKMEGLVLKSLTLSGNPTGKLSIENIKGGHWYLANFAPKETANFYDIAAPSHLKESSKIEIHKCILDNTWFDNIDFSTYKTVSFYRTKFSKTVFTSCTFPDNSITFEKFTTLENIHYPDKKKQNYYKDQYEVYLQLKLALEGTGNFHEAQKLFAIANDALKKLKDVRMADKFILRINRCSNNHGLSIIRPFWLLVIFSVVFYVGYLLTIGRIFNSNEFDWDLVGYYFSFLDLTHRPDFLVEKADLNGASLVIDFLNKVIVGFFIYQVIAAFRKYGKK